MADFVQRVAMKAVIVHEGKVLLLREAKTYVEGTNVGKYHMPGGRIEPGEHWQEALKREVKEETGLEITIGKPLFVGEWFPVIKEVPTHIVALFLVCTPKISEIVLSDEHDDFAWVDPKNYKHLAIMSPEDQVLDEYVKLMSA